MKALEAMPRVGRYAGGEAGQATIGMVVGSEEAEATLPPVGPAAAVWLAGDAWPDALAALGGAADRVRLEIRRDPSRPGFE